MVVVVGIVGAACSGNDARTATATTAPAPSSPTVLAGPTATPIEQRTTQYSDLANWLCHPAKASTPCTVNLDATAKAGDGTLTRDPFTPAKDPKIDCFYVYPTVSTDPGVNSDLLPGADEQRAATQQFARFGAVCRLFAPVYRQVTATALDTGKFGDTAAHELAYSDVLAAWNAYLQNENHGRGVILVGHSQGSMHLVRLIKEQIDPNAAVRARLVSAFLLGTGVHVPAGADVGGDFQYIAACRKPDQTGCVVTYASFSAASPPPANTIFGRGGVLCVNPAALSGGPADLHPYFTSNSVVSASGVTTPYVTFTGQVRAECVNENGASYLKITAGPSLQFPPFLLGAEWGLHLVDANLTMGDMVALAAKQAAAYKGP